jgi:hypothetical protein
MLELMPVMRGDMMPYHGIMMLYMTISEMFILLEHLFLMTFFGENMLVHRQQVVVAAQVVVDVQVSAAAALEPLVPDE